MEILVFGTYDKHRGRLRVILEGLRRSGWTIRECHFPVWGNIPDRMQIGFGRWLLTGLRLLVAYGVLPFKFLFKHRKCDVILVGYLGHLDIFLARMLSLFRRRLIVFDVFISLYDTVVRDRKLVSPHGMAARLLFLLDKYACKCADLILFDTDAHARFFKETFDLYGIPAARVFVSADPSRFEAAEPVQPRPASACRVFYSGHFIPLHGVETMVRAADLLRSRTDIEFMVAGKGQTYRQARRMAAELNLHNIQWLGWIPYEEVLKIAKGADITLGIFGISEKAQNVIPFKVYEMMAAGKAIITADTPAARELLQDEVHCLLVPPADAERLASAILRLASSCDLRFRLMRNAHRLFWEQLVPEKVVRPLIESVEDELFVQEKWIAAPRYRLRMDCVKEILAAKAPGKFLEVGCGAGAFLRWLAGHGFEGVATDLSEEALALASRTLRRYREKVQLLLPKDLQIGTGTLDYVLSFEVLEHIAGDAQTLRVWNSYLKPGGLLLLSVPARQSKWGASDVQVGHYRRYERAGLSKLLEEQGFNVVALQSYGFPLANVTEGLRNLIARKSRPEWENNTQDQLTQRSGINRAVEMKLSFLINDLFLFPFYRLQRWFYPADLGTGYVVEARKR